MNTVEKMNYSIHILVLGFFPLLLLSHCSTDNMKDVSTLVDLHLIISDDTEKIVLKDHHNTASSEQTTSPSLLNNNNFTIAELPEQITGTVDIYVNDKLSNTEEISFSLSNSSYKSLQTIDVPAEEQLRISVSVELNWRKFRGETETVLQMEDKPQTLTLFIKGHIYYSPGGGLVDVDGNEYETVIIEGQEWMAQNLRTRHYRDGSEITTGLSSSEWETTQSGAFGIFNFEHQNAEGINSAEEMAEIYGLLYNGYAVSDTKGLCPDGWRVPSDQDWKTLEQNLGMTQADANSPGWRGKNSNTGGKMKATGTVYWADPNEGATNESGLKGLPAGYRSSDGRFAGIRYDGYFWSSSEENSGSLWSRLLHFESAEVNRNPHDKQIGFAVRCVRN